MQSPSDFPIIARSVSTLRYNHKKQCFTLKPVASASNPSPKAIYFGLNEVYAILVTQLNMIENPTRWENPTADASLPPRFVEFVQNFNKDPTCPAKFCQRIRGTFVVPQIPVDWRIINLAPLTNGAYQPPGPGTHHPATHGPNTSLTPGPHYTQGPNQGTNEQSRALGILLRERELQLEQLERTIVNQNQREWHANRRIKQRPGTPYPHRSPTSPPTKGTKTRTEKGNASMRASPSSRASSKPTSRNDHPSTSAPVQIRMDNTTPSRASGGNTPLPPASTPITTLQPTPLPATTSKVTIADTLDQTLAQEDWSQFEELAAQSSALTLSSGQGESLEVNLAILGTSIDDFFRETIEGTTQQAPEQPLPSTHDVLKTLSFKKNVVAAPTALDPLDEADLIPEDLDDIDMDAEGSPAPESESEVIITT